MAKTKVVKFPIDVLQVLEKDFPNYSNPARIRNMFRKYSEMKRLEQNSFKQIIIGKGGINAKK